MKTEPLLSIVSVTYNDFEGLKKTYKSLKKLLNYNVEWIIKDGGSREYEKKKLSNFIQNLKDKFRETQSSITFISSKDYGIYKGMNISLDLARGEWLIFMNGGDEFYSCLKVLELLNKNINSQYKIILGSTYVYNKNKKFLSKVRQLKSCLGINCYRMPAMHQAQIFHRDIYSVVRFRENYEISADHVYFWESMMNIKKENLILIDPYPIANFYNDGLSSKNSLKSLKDVVISMVKIQKIPLYLIVIATIKRFLAIFYFAFRSMISE